MSDVNVRKMPIDKCLGVDFEGRYEGRDFKRFCSCCKEDKSKEEL